MNGRHHLTEDELRLVARAQQVGRLRELFIQAVERKEQLDEAVIARDMAQRHVDRVTQDLRATLEAIRVLTTPKS